MFTKRNLKGGDVVLHHNGIVSIFIENLGILVHPEGSHGLWDYKNDLTHVLCNDFNIVAVRRPNTVLDCNFSAFANKSGKRVFPVKPTPQTGDRIRVVADGFCHGGNSDWLDKNAPALLPQGLTLCNKGDRGIVLVKAPVAYCAITKTPDSRILCACVKEGTSKIFLVEERGIEVICDE